MKTKIIGLLTLIILFSCGPYQKTKDGYRIKGNSEILFNKADQTLEGKSIISGYVYSRDMELFTDKAVVLIGGKKVETDRNGFFLSEVKPGVYDISADYMGNNKETLKGLKMEDGKRAMVLLELGTTAMY